MPKSVLVSELNPALNGLPAIACGTTRDGRFVTLWIAGGHIWRQARLYPKAGDYNWWRNESTLTGSKLVSAKIAKSGIAKWTSIHPLFVDTLRSLGVDTAYAYEFNLPKQPPGLTTRMERRIWRARYR